MAANNIVNTLNSLSQAGDAYAKDLENCEKKFSNYLQLFKEAALKIVNEDELSDESKSCTDTLPDLEAFIFGVTSDEKDKRKSENLFKRAHLHGSQTSSKRCSRKSAASYSESNKSSYSNRVNCPNNATLVQQSELINLSPINKTFGITVTPLQPIPDVLKSSNGKKSIANLNAKKSNLGSAKLPRKSYRSILNGRLSGYKMSKSSLYTNTHLKISSSQKVAEKRSLQKENRPINKLLQKINSSSMSSTKSQIEPKIEEKTKQQFKFSKASAALRKKASELTVKSTSKNSPRRAKPAVKSSILEKKAKELQSQGKIIRSSPRLRSKKITEKQMPLSSSKGKPTPKQMLNQNTKKNSAASNSRKKEVPAHSSSQTKTTFKKGDIKIGNDPTKCVTNKSVAVKKSPEITVSSNSGKSKLKRICEDLTHAEPHCKSLKKQVPVQHSSEAEPVAKNSQTNDSSSLNKTYEKKHSVVTSNKKPSATKNLKAAVDAKSALHVNETFVASGPSASKSKPGALACKSMTPCSSSSLCSYKMSDLESDSDNEREHDASKPIPVWAQGVCLKNTLLSQHHNPIDADELFGTLELPDLEKIFNVKNRKYQVRSSSANWNSPSLFL